MKLAPLLLAASLAANAALLALYLHRSSSPADSASSTDSTNPKLETQNPKPTNASPTTGPAAAATTEDPKTWASLHPGDLRALAARLRAAGFPPSVIRSVVSAQITADLRPRMHELIAANDEKPFWSTDSGFGSFDPKILAAMRELSREQTRLLTEALGADALASDQELSDFQRRRYGNLSREKTDQLQRIVDDYSELRSQVSIASKGIMLPEDREKLALLEKEKRADLARILSPAELDDWLVRTSNTTSRLRTALTTMNATEEEFRAIYKAQSAFDEKYNSPSSGITYFTEDLMKERQAAQTQVTDQLKLALGEQRAAEYLRATDREFQTINRIAQQANLPATAAVQVYDLRENISKESNRIFADTTLSVEQKRTALQSLAQNTRTQITSTLGTDASRSYLQVAANWLDRVERGSAVTFTPGGGTSSRSLPRPRPPGAPAAPAAPGTTTTTTVIRGGG